MARLPIQDVPSATGTTKQIFDALQRQLGTVPNMARVMATAPAVLQAYAQFHAALAGGTLPVKVREQIALLAADRNRCEYCLAAHSAIGALVGLAPAQMRGAQQGSADDRLAQGALRLAGAVLETRGGIGSGDIDGARAAGLTDAQIAEVVAHVALNVFTNYFNRAFDVDVDFPRIDFGAPVAVR